MAVYKVLIEAQGRFPRWFTRVTNAHGVEIDTAFAFTKWGARWAARRIVRSDRRNRHTPAEEYQLETGD